MKPSARLAALFIFLFFLFFNGLQGYLIVERIAESKDKFASATSAALFATLSDYQKLKSIDSASAPTHAQIVYASKAIMVSRMDSASVMLSTPIAAVVTDTLDPAFLETVLNSAAFRSIDIPLFNRLYKKALHAEKVNTDYRLDTITMSGKRTDRQKIPLIWAHKKKPGYAYSTRPVRLPYNSDIMVFAEVKADPVFTKRDLLWPLLAFAAILLIGNTALVFVYKTIRKQKKINELKTDFINNITHEMKTPITIASAGLDALAHHVVASERTGFYLHTSKKQLILLNEFVERILDAAVQDIPDFTLQKERVDLLSLVDELIQSHSILQRKICSFQLTAAGPIFINGDRLHLQTAFHNVIDNAIKYSGESVNIHICVEENNWECIVKIRDNGKGIPPRFIKNIFEKFFRVPQGDSQSVKGLGIGLYNVKNIVEKHSGDIAVHSKEGSGTEFIITLPKQL